MSQGRWRQLEREPMDFLWRTLPRRLEEARGALGAFLGSDPDLLAFVPNATAGVNAVVRSLSLSPGDEILTTDHAYGACRKALEHVAARAGARVVAAAVPFPLASEEEVVAPILAALSPAISAFGFTTLARVVGGMQRLLPGVGMKAALSAGFLVFGLGLGFATFLAITVSSAWRSRIRGSCSGQRSVPHSLARPSGHSGTGEMRSKHAAMSRRLMASGSQHHQRL